MPLAAGSLSIDRWVTAYYLATPLFLVLDRGLGAPVRVSAIATPNQRLVYYVVLMALGLACHLRPRLTPWVGMGESAANIFLLILAVMLPIWSMPDAVLAGEPVEGPFSRVSLINFILSGSALVVSFHRNQSAALRRPREGGVPRFDL